MENELTEDDLEFIIESLKYTKLKFENYQMYPSIEYKENRVAEAAEVLRKVIFLKKTFREF